MEDIIERMESAAERRFDEITKGLPEGKFRCGCGKIANLDSACTASPNPYSMPICGKCTEEMIEDMKNQSK